MLDNGPSNHAPIPHANRAGKAKNDYRSPAEPPPDECLNGNIAIEIADTDRTRDQKNPGYEDAEQKA
jgi:hypothetical protein